MYQIHEVFYYTEEDGEKAGLVSGWTENGVAPFGLSEKKLKKDLKRMLDSLNKPVLDYETGLAIAEKKDVKAVRKNFKKLIREKEKEECQTLKNMRNLQVK